MDRAFIENGIWQTPTLMCDAIGQRKATLRVSALAGLVTLALSTGPELKLASTEALGGKKPLISQPEMVVHKPADRVPMAHSARYEDVTSSASARRKTLPDDAMADRDSVAPQSSPKPHAPIEILDPTLLKAGDMQVRIAGIAIAHDGKTCRRLDGLMVSCADRAASYLQLLVKGRSVACDKAGISQDGVELGRCRIGETDLAEQMVRQGWARANEKADGRLMLAEASARKQRLGIWQDTDTTQE